MQAKLNSTAERVALWRALHLLQDSPPHVFEDRIGLELAEPELNWQQRPDMGPFTQAFRASILGRSRLVEDLLEQKLRRGLNQYVILGAGLDSFAQRKAALYPQLKVFEIDTPDCQLFKSQRLKQCGYGISPQLEMVGVDFEQGENWVEKLWRSGFDLHSPALISSMGLSMYLSREALLEQMQQISELAPGTVLVLSFLLPLERLEASVRPGVERAAAGAAASGHPWLSFFDPAELIELAQKAGLSQCLHISAEEITKRYFSKRKDGLRPPLNSEEILIAQV